MFLKENTSFAALAQSEWGVMHKNQSYTMKFTTSYNYLITHNVGYKYNTLYNQFCQNNTH